MNIKNTFELIYGKYGDVYNILPFNDTTLEAFRIQKEDSDYIRNLCLMHIRSKNEKAKDIVLEYVNSCIIVNLKEYPLPAFVNKDMKCYINIGVFPSQDVSEFTTPDVFSVYIYAISLYLYVNGKPFADSIEEHISAYLFAMFMKMFGKKSGLMGSYQDLIPRLRFLITLYCHCGIMGHDNSEDYQNKVARSLYTDVSDMKLNYNFFSISDFLKAINENGIIPISANKFSTQMINFGGIYSLPLFEDISRFFATLMSSTVAGNTIFSPYWSKIHPNLFQKLIFFGIRGLELSRSKVR